MSAIVHRCTCGHIEQYHDQRAQDSEVGCSYSWCPAGRHVMKLGESVVIPTLDRDGNTTLLHEPGSWLSPGLAQQANPFGFLCDCVDCRSLYSELTAVAA